MLYAYLDLATSVGSIYRVSLTVCSHGVNPLAKVPSFLGRRFALPEELRSRYASAQAKLFGDFTGERKQLRQMVAEDLLLLASRSTAD